MPHVYKRENSKFYQCRIETKDGPIRRSTGETDKFKASKVAEAWETELAKPAGYLFSVVHPVFTETASIKPATVKQYDASHRCLLRILGDFFLNDLCEDDLKSYIQVRMSECSASRIKRDLAYLSSLYNWATMVEGGPPSNPVRLLNQRLLGLRNGKPRKRWLTEPQFEALLAMVTNPVHRALLTMAVDTGMRRNELLTLKRTDVFLERRVVIIGNLDPLDTKGGEGRLIPLTDRACSTLRDILKHRPTSPWVFTSGRTGKPLRSIHGWWPTLVEKAGLEDFRFHDLRHTFGSWAAQRGVDERILQLWMGHKTPGMTRKYTHLRGADVELALKVFDRTKRGDVPLLDTGEQSISERNSTIFRRWLASEPRLTIEELSEEYGISPGGAHLIIARQQLVARRQAG